MNLKRWKEFHLDDMCDEEEIFKKRFIVDFSKLRLTDGELNNEPVQSMEAKPRNSPTLKIENVHEFRIIPYYGTKIKMNFIMSLLRNPSFNIKSEEKMIQENNDTNTNVVPYKENKGDFSIFFSKKTEQDGNVISIKIKKNNLSNGNKLRLF